VTEFPQVLAGRYEIRDLIGRGGMAEVHLGYDKRLSRIIAIKLLRSDIAGDPTFQARFRREAQSAAALNHPTIVAVYDSGEEEITTPNGSTRSVPYIVMEYVEGHTVRELLGDGEAVPIPEAVEITTGVLDALEYSHRAGIVHRDIKPGNIMLTSTGAVKVMDFGIARAMEDSSATVTQTHAVVGTAQYLSPEQARGEIVDARSDLYSTGCLLYELLTGQPPFTGDSAVAIAYQHVREIPKPPSSLAADVPESLDRVVLKALAKTRDDRYQDAAHMRTELLAAERGMAVSAPATDTWQSTTAMPSATAPSPAVPAPPPSAAPPQAGPEKAAEDKRPRRRWWVWVLLIILLILAGTLIGMFASGRFPGGKPSPTPSPTPSRSPLWLQDGPPPLPEPTELDSIITALPEDAGDTVAITVDDGADSSVVDAYLDFARDSGVRLTFFVTSSYPGWTDCKDKMTPLVESGQVQLGNHTVTHAGLTSLDESGIISEVSQCEEFLNSTYGVTGTPFIRPPYGYRDGLTDSVCAKLGYTTSTMWYGSFGDSGLLTEDVLLGEAQKWLLAQHIVIGHANFPTVTHLYGQIIDILRERNLLTATLDDVYFGPGHNRHV